MQPDRHQWIRQLSEEFFQESGELHGSVLRQVHGRWVSVNGLGQLLQTTDIAVFTENTLNRDIFTNVSKGLCHSITNLPIWRMADTTSWMKLGTLKFAREAPSKESAPSRSTSNSRGTPKTPTNHVNQLFHNYSIVIRTFLLHTLLISFEQLAPKSSLFGLN